MKALIIFLFVRVQDVRAEMGPQERQFFEDSKSASLRSQEVVEETKTEKETLSSGDRGAKVVKKVQRHKKNKQPNLNIFEDDNDDDLEITPIDLELSWMGKNIVLVNSKITQSSPYRILLLIYSSPSSCPYTLFW